MELTSVGFGRPSEKRIPQSQVISKQRVSEYGEVLTAEREVNAMLDLVKHETERLESRFFESSCGNGNFLVEVLTRKLSVIEKHCQRSQREYERYAVLAVSSIYGIDIIEDNVRQCQSRMLEIFESHYRRIFKSRVLGGCIATVSFVLERNIVWGNALTMETVGDHPAPIVFSEWSLANRGQIKRRDFTFHSVLRDATTPLLACAVKDVFIQKLEREYPLVNFWGLLDAG